MAWLGHLFVCWLVADFFSGLFHWFEDRYVRTSWPLLGGWVAAPNELHHREPTAFLRGGYFYRNSTTLLPMLGVGVVVAYLAPRWLPAVFFLSQANEIHAWSHQRCSGWVRTLQAMGLLQSPQQHAQHHRSPFAERFCVLSNFVNPVLDGLRFWRGLEWLLGCCGLRIKEEAYG